jgi:hypothetical protein
VTDSTGDPHVRSSLGLYLLGASGRREREAIERHLASCRACQAESDELGEVVAALALLSEEEGREIVEQFGVPAPVSTQRTAGPAAAVATRPGPAATTSIRPGGSRRPASVRPPAGRRLDRRRVRGLLGIAGLLVVVLLSAGVVLRLTVGGGGGTGGPTPVDITLAATAADTSTGASVSVIASGHDGAVTVRATVTGLHAGIRYRLYAVLSDARTRVVTSWTGAAAPQDVSGVLPVRVGDLSFFTVTLADSTPVVSAAVRKSSPR